MNLPRRFLPLAICATAVGLAHYLPLRNQTHPAKGPG